MTFSSEIVSDASTFLWNGSTQVALMRPGVYVFFYRGTVTPDAGAIRVLLHIGASTFRNQYTGAGGNVTLAESITYVNTSTTPVAVRLELTIGTSLGSANLELPTMLTIVKVR
jgi:hypothetical protein